MANVIRGEHTVTLNGVDYRLCLDMNAFTEACSVLDVGINGLMALMEGDDPKPHVVRALVYGAMMRHNPIPLADVMDFVTQYGMAEMAGELQALALTVMPKAEAGNVPPQGKAKSSSPTQNVKPKTSGGGKGKP